MPFRLSAVYAAFNTFVPNFITYATAQATRLGIPDDTITALGALQTAWTAAWNVYSNHATQTAQSREAIKDQYHLFDARLRSIQQQLKNTDGLELTADDYEQLGIHRDKTTRTPAVPITIAPVNLLLDSKHLHAKVSSSLPDTETENLVRLPDNVESIRRLISIVDTGEPEPTTGYDAIPNSHRGVHVIVFQNEDVNKTAWLRTAYVNSRGQVGPDSVALPIPIF